MDQFLEQKFTGPARPSDIVLVKQINTEQKYSDFNLQMMQILPNRLLIGCWACSPSGFALQRLYAKLVTVSD
jgi:hypothetical protein